MVNPKHFKQLDKLTGWRQKVFLLALAERSLPNLQLYAELQDRRKASRQVERFLDDLWQRLSDPALAAERQVPVAAASLLDEWHTALEVDESFGADAARLVVDLAEAAGQAVLHPEAPLAREMAERSFGLITQMIELQDGVGLDDEALVALFAEHPLTETELRWQRQLANTLREHVGAPTDEWLNRLRRDAANNGVSGIGISLEEEA